MNTYNVAALAFVISFNLTAMDPSNPFYRHTIISQYQLEDFCNTHNLQHVYESTNLHGLCDKQFTATDIVRIVNIFCSDYNTESPHHPILPAKSKALIIALLNGHDIFANRSVNAQ